MKIFSYFSSICLEYFGSNISMGKVKRWVCLHIFLELFLSFDGMNKHVPLNDIITQYGYYILKIYWIYYIGYVHKEYMKRTR